MLVSFALAAASGATVWALSPALTGRKEPWDASLLTYLLSMLAGGCVLAAICPRFFFVPVAGIYLGQIAYGRLVSNLWGEVVLLMFSVAFFGVPPAVVGAGMVFAVSMILEAAASVM